MTDNYRMERVKRLLDDLRHEITRGMMDGEIDEHLGFDFVVPVSKAPGNDIVQCEFRTRPARHFHGRYDGPQLRVVK